MPSTLVGLVVFVLLLAPGLCFILQREARIPARKSSTFRETALVALASIALESTLLIVFAAIRWEFPNHTPKVNSLARDAGAYFGGRPGYVAVWGGGLLIAACALGAVLGWKLPADFGGSIKHSPVWWQIFERDSTALMYVGCQLVEGGWMQGPLSWYSTEGDEGTARDLSLVSPILYRPSGASDLSALGADHVIISSAQVKFLTVQALDPAAIDQLRASAE